MRRHVRYRPLPSSSSGRPIALSWQVVQVWTSQKDLVEFNDRYYLPALGALGQEAFPSPPVVTDFDAVALSNGGSV